MKTIKWLKAKLTKTPKLNNLQHHAQKEFDIMGWPGDCELQTIICDHLIELLGALGGHGHSGTSHFYLLDLFEKLARFQPISPLTGEPDEWIEVTDILFQNKRDSEVFKEDGKAYWISGIIFEDADGCTYTNSESRVPVIFPWTRPESKIVKENK